MKTKETEAIELAKRAYELLLSDNVEDHMEGLQTMAEARDLDPEAVAQFEREQMEQAERALREGRP